MTDTKPKWASRTLWANLTALVAAITGVFGIDIGFDPEEQIALVTGIMAVVNIVLRFRTNQGLQSAWPVTLLLLLLLGGCAYNPNLTPEQRQALSVEQSLLVGCRGYAGTLNALAVLRSQMDEAEQTAVEGIVAVASPLCRAAAEGSIQDPQAALDTLRAQLRALLLLEQEAKT